MTIVFTSFKHPKLPISIKISVTLLQIIYICMTENYLYLHDIYISKFEFMNYLFANMLVPWLKMLLKCKDSETLWAYFYGV